jgi:hypothetical protein
LWKTKSEGLSRARGKRSLQRAGSARKGEKRGIQPEIGQLVVVENLTDFSLMERIAAMKSKVGDTVWYSVDGSDNQVAKIEEIVGRTHAKIRILTGPQAGTVIEAPWGIVRSTEEDK